jgi:hypothetical protein
VKILHNLNNNKNNATFINTFITAIASQFDPSYKSGSTNCNGNKDNLYPNAKIIRIETILVISSSPSLYIAISYISKLLKVIKYSEIPNIKNIEEIDPYIKYFKEDSVDPTVLLTTITPYVKKLRASNEIYNVNISVDPTKIRENKHIDPI